MPVFNVERYLERCLESLLAQTLKDIEIIVVEDGSTDRSPEIAYELGQRDPRIRLIRQSNQGLSGARNTGLKAAIGKFVGFVDSDDWVAPEMFERMYRQAEADGAELCACDYALSYADGRISSGTLGLRGERLELDAVGLDNFWNGKQLAVVVWNKLYLRRVITEYGLRFESSRNVFSEDVLFNLCFLKHVSVCTSVADSYYFYMQREDSLMNSPKPDYLKRELFLVDRFSDYYADYADQAVYQVLLTRLFFERVQNACLYSLEMGARIGKVRRELVEAGGHSLFQPCMRAAGEDRSLWLPMRLFARICGRRLYRPAVWYLRLFLGVSKFKQRLAGAEPAGIISVSRARTI